MKLVCVYPSLKHLLMKIFCEIKEDMHLTGLGQGAIVNIKVSESWLTNLPLWSSELDLDQHSGCSNLASPTGPALPRSSPTRPASPAWRGGPWLQSTFKALTSYKTRGQRGMGTTSWPRYKGGDGSLPILWYSFYSRLDIAMLESMKARSWNLPAPFLQICRYQYSDSKQKAFFLQHIFILRRRNWSDNDIIAGSTPWGRELYRDLI